MTLTENPGQSSHPPQGGHEHHVPASPAGRGRPLARGPVHGFLHRKVGPFAKKNKLLFMAILASVGVVLIFGSMRIVENFTGKKDQSPKKSGQEGGTLAVNVVEMKPERFVDPMVAVGTIQGGNEIPLRFEVDGIIELFEFRDGDRVRKGDVIARLNQRDTYLKFKKARLELEQMEKLYAIGGVSLNKLEEAKVTADLAASEMEKTVLRCPRDGVLGNKEAEVGEFVTPSKKVATLVNIENVLVRVGIIEKEIDRVFPGQKVVITVDTYPNVEFTGKVDKINTIVTPGSRTLQLDALLANDGGLLLPGMFARVRITIFEQDNALVVPNDAVEKTSGGGKVYVVTKENKAEERAVEVSYVSSQFSLISKGLEPGDLVITQRPNDLKNGANVKVIEKS
jgi:multidrug efflux pump subunit AcrA (membrane-fusion protein)